MFERYYNKVLYDGDKRELYIEGLREILAKLNGNGLMESIASSNNSEILNLYNSHRTFSIINDLTLLLTSEEESSSSQ